jgi:MFS transporter, DHA2 family, metal-tetracycline-proton antiporter
MDVLGSPAPTRIDDASPGVPGRLWTGLLLGLLLGPTAFGVSASAVALPAAAAELREDAGTAAWVLTAYAFALGVGTVLFGRIADSRGVRVTLQTGVLLLGVGSLACAAAPNFAMLVAGRLAQGAGSGAMAASALILAVSAEAARRGMVIGTLTAVMAGCAGGATLIGGAATVALSWRITVVLPALSLAIVPFCLRMASVYPGKAGERIDVAGAGLLASAVAALLVVIQTPALNLPIPLAGVVALIVVVATVALVRRVLVRPNSLLPRRLTTEPALRVASMIGFSVFGGYFAVLFAAPQVLVHTHGWSVFAVGVALLPGAVLGAVLSRFATHLAVRLGDRLLLAATATSLAMLLAVAGATGAGTATVIAAASFGFIAFGITQAVLVNQVSTVIPQVDRGIATGLLNLAFVTGGAVGAALAGALVRSLDLDGALAAVAALPLIAAVVAVSRPWR